MTMNLVWNEYGPLIRVKLRQTDRRVDTIFKGLCSMRGTLAGHVDWFNSRLTLMYRRTG